MELHCKNFGHFDLVVVGGGCTGLFAAVRAARLGLKAAVEEQSGCFGGMATNGLVNVWHSLYDSFGTRQIIGGLTGELEAGLSGPQAAYDQLPFEIMVQTKMRNLIPVGRMIHADEGAFGALRVMVNLNQLGEAAGAGAYLAVRQGKPVWEVGGKNVEVLL